MALFRNHSRVWLFCIVLSLAAAWLMPPHSVQAQAGCTDLLTDGGFEAGSGWILGITPLTPEIVTHTKHSGDRSLALGITKGGNVEGYSSARKLVTAPAGAGKLTLSFWFYAMTVGNTAGDGIELVLLEPDGKTVLDKPWTSRNDSRVWNQLTFDISRWRGRAFYVYFNIYNDGHGGTAGMFLDDVTLVSCPGATSVPTVAPTTPVTPAPTATSAPPTATSTVAPPAPTATGTAAPPAPTATGTTAPPVPTWTPGACPSLVQNGGFESSTNSWIPGADALPASVVSSPLHTGSAALRLGSQTEQRTSYSSVKQAVTIPAGASKLTIDFWTYTWNDGAAGADRQEMALLDAGGGVIVKPWSVQANERTWQRQTFDLVGFGGQTVYLYFNVYNDGTGGHAAMFLDDVQATPCDATSATPAASSRTGGGSTTSFTPQMTRIALGSPAPVPTLIPESAGSGLAPATLMPSPSATPAAGGMFRRALSEMISGWPREGIWLGAAVVVVLAGLLLWLLLSFLGGGGRKTP